MRGAMRAIAQISLSAAIVAVVVASPTSSRASPASMLISTALGAGKAKKPKPAAKAAPARGDAVLP